jgi:hypothetical protein
MSDIKKEVSHVRNLVLLCLAAIDSRQEATSCEADDYQLGLYPWRV